MQHAEPANAVLHQLQSSASLRLLHKQAQSEEFSVY